MPSAIVAQNLTQLLANTTQLSSLTALLSSYPGVANSLANITNVTLLAPSNDALAKFTNSTAFQALASSPNGNKTIEDLLSYHVLQGEYYASNITDTPAFIHTLLNDTTYTNVTGGPGTRPPSPPKQVNSPPPPPQQQPLPQPLPQQPVSALS